MFVMIPLRYNFYLIQSSFLVKKYRKWGILTFFQKKQFKNFASSKIGSNFASLFYGDIV